MESASFLGNDYISKEERGCVILDDSVSSDLPTPAGNIGLTSGAASHLHCLQVVYNEGDRELVETRRTLVDAESVFVDKPTPDVVSAKNVVQSSVEIDGGFVGDARGGMLPTEDSQASNVGRSPLDLASPITLTSETVVVINGRECVLRVDPGSNHLVAYPLKLESHAIQPSLECRRRGRPRKVVLATALKVEGSSSAEDLKGEPCVDDRSGIPGVLSEQENNAAEGLLGLSVDSSGRKSPRLRKKSTLLDDSVVKEGHLSDDMVRSNSATGPKDGTGQSEGACKSAETKLITVNQIQNYLANMGLPVRRGRGRPRRTPLPSGCRLPSIILPTSNSQSVFLANLQAGSISRTLPPLLPKTVGKGTSIIIEQEDGSEHHIIVSESKVVPPREPAASRMELLESRGVRGDGDDVRATETGDTAASDAGMRPPEGLAFVQIDPQQIIPTVTLQAPFTVIDGVRTKAEDLFKLKCSRCEHQAYYSQQLQDHIVDCHATDLADAFKCKCCSYLTFRDDDLESHFKENHPKCMCDVCGFTAEHTYIVKRHMQRHDTAGCACTVCGRQYKDQYILKMHYKMVHMPAEVLFQCNVCSKEFTRKAHLKRHLRTHNILKPYKCPHCEYRGCERSDINKHILIHNEPKHVCDVCGKTFRHVKNKELHVKRHMGQRDYKCGVCNFYGYTFTDIRKHIERRHTDQKHSMCTLCGAAFKTDALLQEHRERVCQVLMLEMNESSEQDEQDVAMQLLEAGHLMTDSQLVVNGNPVTITINQLDDMNLMEVQMVEEENLAAEPSLQPGLDDDEPSN